MNKPAPRLFMHTASHGLLTYVAFWLAYVFLDGIDTYALSPSFKPFAAMITEEHLGYVCLTFGLFGFVTLWPTNWKLKTFSAFVLAAFHLFFAITFKEGGVQSGTAPGVYFGYASLGILLAYSTAHLGQRVKNGMVPPSLAG